MLSTAHMACGTSTDTPGSLHRHTLQRHNNNCTMSRHTQKVRSL